MARNGRETTRLRVEVLQRTIRLVLTVAALSGCRGAGVLPVIRPRPGSPCHESALADFNRGAALLEQYQYARAAEAFAKVLEATPDWTAARYNLAIAYFNMQEQAGAADSLKRAKQALETVLASDPNHLHARFCLGLHHQHVGDNAKAMECFKRVHQADPHDPHVAYKYAETLIGAGRRDEGARLLERVVELDPGFVSAVYRLAMQHQRSGQPDKAKQLLIRFKQLKPQELTGGSFTVLKTYGTIGKYYMALGADNLPLPRREPASARIVFSPQVRSLAGLVACLRLRKHASPHLTEHAHASVDMPPAGPTAIRGVAAGDLDGDGDIDLCITSLDAGGATSVFLNDGKGTFSQGKAIADKGIAPSLGDVDNDGDIDLWLGRAGTDLLLANDGKGNLAPSDLKLPDDADGVTTCARMLDIDSDGDLDLLAFTGKAWHGLPGRGRITGKMPVPQQPTDRARLYNNNRDGSFEDIAQKTGLAPAGATISTLVYDDFDNDRDLDIILFPVAGAPVGWVNDRGWQHHTLGADKTGLTVDGVVLGATSGDPDNDGDRDLLVFTDESIHLFINQGRFRFALDRSFADRCGRAGASGGQFADMDNDGDLDIVVADAAKSAGKRGPALFVNEWPKRQFTPVRQIDPGNLLAAIEYDGYASCVVADFTGDGRCDIFLAPAGVAPLLIENVTAGGHWIELDLAGSRGRDNKSRSNNSAIGARVDIKAGAISQQHVVGIPSGPVACPPLRIHAGLGPYAKVDWLRVTWPDAVLQAELELPADQVAEIVEVQRKVSSCPHLFAWNGTHFEFVSDFGGMGGVGYLLEPGVYSAPDPTEYVAVANLRPRQGKYVLQVVEPIEEVVYFDEAKLIAVDHPVGTQVYPNEMMAVTAEPPAFELFLIGDVIEPVVAVDHRGVDVTDQLRRIDRLYAGCTQPDHRFVGYAEGHYVVLDLGARLRGLSAGGRVVLFLNGWVEYPYSSTNFAAAQAGVRLKAPSVEVLRHGQWVELFSEVGYPAGIRHTMTLDVTGKVLPTDTKIRISTNMELYWDRIFLAEVLGDAGVRATEAWVETADLHFLGYPREYSPDGRLPNLYDYGSVDRALPWKTMAGAYTRYGPVTELVHEADDCYVIMGPGEQLTLSFDADAFGPVPAGCTRSFILKTDSFCKDMDLYSAWPDTVDPLPFHGMTEYPYGKEENYPRDAKHSEYHRRFNTRRVSIGER